MNLAVFYILSGEGYIDQARRSAMSLDAHMPDVQRLLFTPDQKVDPGEAFHHVYALPARQHDFWFLDCTCYLSMALQSMAAMGYNSLVYLDSDTLVVEPFYDLFGLLDTFDLVAAHAPGRVTCPTVWPIPDCFPELNIGVIGLWNQPPLRRFVDTWVNQYCAHNKVYGNNDQGSLRETLYNYRVETFRFYVMPPEYNCRPLGTGVFLKGKARIIHSNSPRIQEMAESINRETGMRIWKP